MGHDYWGPSHWYNAISSSPTTNKLISPPKQHFSFIQLCAWVVCKTIHCGDDLQQIVMEKNFNWPSNWDPFVICELSFGVKLVQSP
jgi:hypothetical protein